MLGAPLLTGQNFLNFMWLFTLRKQSLGQGNILTGVFLSWRREGVDLLPSVHHWSHDHRVWGWRVCIQGGLYWGDLQWGGSTPMGGGVGRPPDTWDTTGYGQQVGRTCPTGMHSCWNFFSKFPLPHSRVDTSPTTENPWTALLVVRWSYF